MTPLIGCSVKRVPEHKAQEAAAAAIAENPANRPGKGLPLEPQHLALVTSKYWSAKGVRLTVQFLDRPETALRTKLLAHMNAWGKWGNVSFVETANQGQVRIARQAGDGYWSYLGVDILSIPVNQATMNLDSFTMQTPDSEFYRVVRHETGHTLGFPHEHLRHELIARLDHQKTIAYFLEHDGWDAAMTTAQVLTPLSDAELIETPEADQLSIMCYQLPGEITTDGKPIVGGTDIDPLDQKFVAQVYPLAVTPPVPPAPAGRIFGLHFPAAVSKGQPIDFRSPVAFPAGDYDVSHHQAAAADSLHAEATV